MNTATAGQVMALVAPKVKHPDYKTLAQVIWKVVSEYTEDTPERLAATVMERLRDAS